MNNKLLNKRIPTIFGIGFVMLAIIFTTIIVRTQTGLKSKASNSEEPQNVKVANISDDSFTVTYQTDAPTAGSVNFGKDRKLGSTELEDLDKEKGSLTSHNVHSITVKKLTPATSYQLVIVSGQNTFLNNGSPFEIETGPSISSPSAIQSKIKGKVVLPNGNPPIEALVYLSSDNSQLLSTAVGKNGEFNFSLKDLRSEDLNSYFTANENTFFKLEAVSQSLKSTVSISLNNADSIPTITLSNDYDFTNEIPAASKSADAEIVSFPAITTKPKSLKPQILIPQKGQTFTDQQPQFRGTSLPNEIVEIIIHSDENIQTRVKADSNGNWIYRPPNILSPGQHTITIKTKDSLGILTTLTQSFTVFAQGSQVSESATPSATPTQKATPTPTPIQTPTPSPTIIVIIPSPTPTLTFIPTNLPIESKGGLPPTGNSSIVLIIGGVFTAISGIALFLLTRTIP